MDHGRRGGHHAVLARYVCAAVLSRTADAGAVVGLVLLATAGAGSGASGRVAGVLAACITAPHLVGPVLARRLDRSADGRYLLAGCCVVYGLALACATLTFGHVPLVLSLAILVCAGLCGPILTGGLSSQLATLMPDDEKVRRRAQGWDAITYGVAGSLGPALVALLAATTSPLAALLLLAAGAVVAAAFVLSLPVGAAERDAVSGEALRFRDTVRVVAGAPGLRRATAATTATSLVGGTIAIFAIGLATELGRLAASGALLPALFGVGNLVGSSLATIRPLRGEPDPAVLRLCLVMALAFLAGGLSPLFVVAALAFFAAGVVNGPLFAATLASRTRYSPPTGHAQIFVAMAAIKVAASAAGSALAGVVGLHQARLGLVVGAGLIAAVTGILELDRRSHPAHLDVVAVR